MKKIFLILALLGVLGFASQASAGVVVSFGVGGGGYCGRGYPSYYYAPGYYGYYGPVYSYGPGYYYHRPYYHRHYYYRRY